MRKTSVWAVMLLCFASALPALAEEAEPERLLVLDLKAARRDRGAAKALTARLTHGLADRLEGVTVYAAADLARLADLEVEKQKLGCDAETASCLSEIADAFGARLVSYGNIGTIGRGRFLEVTIVDVREAKPVERVFLKGEDPGALLDALELELESTARAVRAYLGVATPTPAAPVVTGRAPVKKTRKPLARRSAVDKIGAQAVDHQRRRRAVQALEERYAVEVATATSIFVAGGLATGTCLSVCGVGAMLSSTSSSSDPLTRTNPVGQELMACGGIGGGLSLLATLGLGMWKASEAVETGKQIELAKKQARRLSQAAPMAY